MLVVYSLLQNCTLPTCLLLSEHLWTPVLGDGAGCSVYLVRTWRLDISILRCRWQFSSQVSRHFACAHQRLVACRVRVTGQVEQLAFVREDVLDPQARGIGMRCSLVDDGDVRANQ